MSIHERSAELINLVEKSGMRDQLEARVEEQHLEERRRLVAEIKTKRAEYERVSPAIDRAFREAWDGVARAEAQLRAAQQVFNQVAQQSHGAQCQAGDAQLVARLQEIAPHFVRDAIDSVEEMSDFLRGTTRGETRRVSEWTWAGRLFHTIDVSNAQLVGSIRQKCATAIDEMRSMALDVSTPLIKQRTRCEALVAECKAVALPQLRDDATYQRYQERKHARAAKSA
ncbi:hypothetical protein N4S61_07510 [Burkholderia pseudomallei]|uniref:hypothetical protein n=1 Tax=Burkholderia TaxID=32008 RepID=UPI000A8C595F|nr:MULTISPECIES: hypothetical protein [Burkholderia]MCS6601679.1 hypothetical protein [Burkholderia pseudomallei]MCT7345866.1 hypothetical protein [Burkholderia pseudomallei]MCT7917865.1 hypothetical protein [Burkholderia pseudomallei]